MRFMKIFTEYVSNASEEERKDLLEFIRALKSGKVKNANEWFARQI